MNLTRKLYDVAIIVPTYNAGPPLLTAIESILAAKELRIQVIVIEDGSGNPSRELLSKQYPALFDKKELPHFIEYHEQKTTGAYRARLNALKFCRSKFVKFLDQDDVLMTGALAKEVEAFNDETDVVMSNWIATDVATGVVIHSQAPTYTDPITDFLMVGGCPTSAALYRTQVAQRALVPIESFTPVRADDWLIFAQVCLSGARYKTISIESYSWNQYHDQLSKRSAHLLLTEQFNILNYCEDTLRNSRQLSSSRKLALAHYYARTLLSSYENDRELFSKILYKVSTLNSTYKNTHGHKLYQALCSLLGLKYGTVVYSGLKNLVT